MNQIKYIPLIILSMIFCILPSKAVDNYALDLLTKPQNMWFPANIYNPALKSFETKQKICLKYKGGKACYEKFKPVK